MKSTHANRGQAFEMLLNLVNQQYKVKNIALINKRPTPMKVIRASQARNQFVCAFDEKSTVDYDGFYKGKGIAFEAKSVEISRFELKNMKIHQVDYLKQAEKNGAKVFVLIEFRHLHRVYFTPLSLIEHALQTARNGGRKSIPMQDFEMYAFEVQRGRVPLDYLAVLDDLEKRQKR